MDMNTRSSLIAAALLAAVGATHAGETTIDEVVVTARHAPYAHAASSAAVLAESKEVLSSVTPQITIPKLQVELPKIAAERN
jgi:hypothetical protein